MQWSLTIRLQHFSFTLSEKEKTRKSEMAEYEEPDFLTTTFHNLQFSIDLTPKVDHELRDVFQWRIHGGLDSLEAR